MEILENNWAILRNLIHKTMNTATNKQSITHIEAFYTGTQTIQVTIRDSEIQSQNKITDFGVGFRVTVQGNRVGFSCTNSISDKNLINTFNKAFTIAKVSSEINSYTLPDRASLPNIKGLYDPEIKGTTVEDAVNIAKRGIIAAEDVDKKVIAKSGQVSFQIGWKGILNNFDVDYEEPQTRAWMILGGSGQHGGEVTGGCYDWMLCRDTTLDPEIIGKNVGNRVIKMFNKKTVKSFQGTVIFSPEAVSYQISDVLKQTLSGSNIIAGSSPWSEKLGQHVGSENLTVNDDPTVEKGFSSRSFDDEGGVSQKTNLILQGRLKNFLLSATTATRLKMKNTTNASRYGGFDLIRNIIGDGYRTKPFIYPSNLVIQEGKKTKEELISEIEKGVLIESMAGFPQKGSGIISAQLSRAFYIEDGVVNYPLKDVMVSGVAYDWLKEISGIGNDAKQFENSIVPSLRIENVKIIGT